ncbi:MAG: NAD(P)/FAD-dependent oxidoreductase [Candidatus Eremiobacteraeota bacterium]|nr:NAD(P)/FAD-dependent oxidoreductase [Candidatus Eremiobacteraeota bacterium]
MRTHDVAVIGAGIAGLWCARALASRGVDVLLIDTLRELDETVRTTGIFVRRTLEDFDLPSEAFGPPIRRVVLHSPREREIVFETATPEFRIADMRVLSRALLRDSLRAGITFRPDTRFDGLAAATPVRLQLRTGIGRERRTTYARARFVVGADGARSRVAASLGLARNTDFLLGVEDVYENVELAVPGVLHCYLSTALAPGYIGWFAHAGTSAHLGIASDVDRFQSAGSLRTLADIARHTVAPLPNTAHERRGGLIPCNGVLPRIACAYGLLVGDAAGAVSPLTAGGLDGCVRLSDFAARVIPEHLAGDRHALDRYDGRRFASRFIARRWMRRLLRISNDEMLELLCAALALPLGRQLGAHVFFGRGSFPDIDPLVPKKHVAHRLAQ